MRFHRPYYQIPVAAGQAARRGPGDQRSPLQSSDHEGSVAAVSDRRPRRPDSGEFSRAEVAAAERHAFRNALRSPITRALWIALALAGLAATTFAAAPQIVSTVPAVGATNVDPSTSAIAVTFDQDMAPGFSWTGGGPDYPPVPEGQRPSWRDKRTAVLPVKLESGHYYRVGINSKSHQNFRSVGGVPARPSAVYFTTAGAGGSETAKTQKPTIVEMVPANNATKVDPTTAELRVTFSVPMAPGFSWTGGGDEYPATPEGARPHWSEDRLTCILPVKLEPGHKYRLGLNSPSHKNFQSAAGVPLDPVVYTFKTGK